MRVLGYHDIATIFSHLQLIVAWFTPTFKIAVSNIWYFLIEIP